jgi:hypothetical protein
LHPAQIEVYLRGMMQEPHTDRPDRAPLKPVELLEFRPWMLALAVFLACAIGIVLMERVREDRDQWAQVGPQDGAAAQTSDSR